MKGGKGQERRVDEWKEGKVTDVERGKGVREKVKARYRKKKRNNKCP